MLLLQLAAFLDAAWPPPALDPLTVRTSITLEEIVAERLVGPLRGHQAQKLRQSRQQLQVRGPRLGKRQELGCMYIPFWGRSAAGMSMSADRVLGAAMSSNLLSAHGARSVLEDLTSRGRSPTPPHRRAEGLCMRWLGAGERLHDVKHSGTDPSSSPDKHIT